MRFINLLLFFTVLYSHVNGQDKSLYQKWWYIQGGDTMPYRLLLPKGYNPDKEFPLVVFLHGRGESGKDNNKQLVHGSSLFLQDSIRSNYPAFVLFPQCSNDNYWSNVVHIKDSSGKRKFHFLEYGDPTLSMKLLLGLLNYIQKSYKIEKDRIYVMGLSMGGMGTFELVRRSPGTFAAAIAICGGANPAIAKKIRKTDWWLFHGMKDDVVDPGYTIAMETALSKRRAKVKATYFPNANHNSWDPAFAQPGLLKWLFSKRR